MTKVLGMDISMNHGAIVELTGDKLTNFWYYTEYAGSAAKSKKRGFRLDPEILKIKDKHAKGMKRLVWVEDFIGTVLSASNAEFAGIEDYAIRAEQGAHYLGEVGAVARLQCWHNGVKFRLHDPTTVKMFAAHDGTCAKDAVCRAVVDRWGVDFEPLDQPPPQPTSKVPNPKQNRQTSEDLSDAYVIARMVLVEAQLRMGEINMSDLHEKEIRVFNRTTKTYPVNLLDREWICNQ